MNLLKKLLSPLTNSIKSTNVVEFCPSLLSSAKLPNPSSHNYAPYIDSYGDRAWVYTCVNTIAENVSSADFVLKNKEGEIVSDSPVLNLMYRPNKFMSGRSLRQWIIASLELTGNAYILKDSILRDGTPTELFPLFSQLVEIIPGKNSSSPIEGYKYRAGSQTAYYKASDVIHFKYFNPFDFFYGLSPISAARSALDSLEKAESYNRAFFEHSGTLSGVLHTENKLDDATRNRIINAWNEKYQGAKKAHKVALLEGGLKWQNTSLSQRDMDFIESVKMDRETILSIFHIPPALVGLFEQAQQFNTKEQQRIFWQLCVLPKQSLMLETFTEFLLPHFDKTKTMYFDKDISQVACLKEEELERAQTAKIYAEIGYSKQEIALALGLPFGAKKQTRSKK